MTDTLKHQTHGEESLGRTQQSESKTRAEKLAKDNKERQKVLLEKMADAVNYYKGEANIPLTHEYWGLVNEFRSLENQ